MLALALSLYGLTASILLFYSVKKNISLLEKQETIAEQLDESLELLDVCYANVSIKSKIEVFSDEPVVKDLLSDIANAREAILLIANKLEYSIIVDEEEDK